MCSSISWWMARATTSRGARSFHSGEYFSMNGCPSGVSRMPPSPRTASLIRNPSAPGHRQGGGMELDVLGVDDARPGPRRHRQPVAARAQGVGGVAVDAPNARRWRGRSRRQRAVDGAPVAVEDVRAVTGDRLVGVERVARVVRVGDQVDGGGIGEPLDVGLRLRAPRSARA